MIQRLAVDQLQGTPELSGRVQTLRGIAIGRRKYLFAATDSGGERAAAINSLIGTAHIADRPVNRVDEFLSWHCAGQLAVT